MINSAIKKLSYSLPPFCRLIRIPQARSFFDESSSDDISERLFRTFTHDVQVIDETLEALLEKTFSEGRDEGTSFLADITSHS